MGLIIEKVIEKNTPAQIAALQLRQIVSVCFDQMLQTHKSGANVFWNSGIDPQLIANELGPDAAELFRLDSILFSALNAVKAETASNPVPADATVELHKDGTATITLTK